MRKKERLEQSTQKLINKAHNIYYMRKLGKIAQR